MYIEFSMPMSRKSILPPGRTLVLPVTECCFQIRKSIKIPKMSEFYFSFHILLANYCRPIHIFLISESSMSRRAHFSIYMVHFLCSSSEIIRSVIAILKPDGISFIPQNPISHESHFLKQVRPKKHYRLLNSMFSSNVPLIAFEM